MKDNFNETILKFFFPNSSVTMLMLQQSLFYSKETENKLWLRHLLSQQMLINQLLLNQRVKGKQHITQGRKTHMTNMTNRNICLYFAKLLSWQHNDDNYDACFCCTSCPVNNKCLTNIFTLCLSGPGLLLLIICVGWKAKIMQHKYSLALRVSEISSNCILHCSSNIPID